MFIISTTKASQFRRNASSLACNMSSSETACRLNPSPLLLSSPGLGGCVPVDSPIAIGCLLVSGDVTEARVVGVSVS